MTNLNTNTSGDDRAFGVFKPVGHVVIAFPRVAQADAAVAALAAVGLEGNAVRRVSDREMFERTENELRHAGVLASVGQEANLARVHRDRAQAGHHFLVVRTGDDDVLARRAAEVAREQGAVAAQAYGTFVIEELITEPAAQQVAESPARGLDTPSTRQEAPDGD